MTIVTILVAVVALAVAGLALRRADVVERRAREWMTAPQSPTANPPATQIPSSQQPSVDSQLAERVASLERAGAANAISKVAVVRYDAFEEMGGRQSFSAALVDEHGRGLVLTAIHGRAETRSYLKQVPVTPDSGQRELSPEETQAVADALRGSR